MGKCLPRLDPDNLWKFCPSIPAAILFSVLFALTLAAHIFQARKYRNNYAWTIIMGAIWETASFIIRIVSIQNPTSEAAYDPSFLFFLLAPLWINAFDYMLLGRMVYHFLPDKKLWKIKAQRMALLFVLLDIVSFAVQILGGLLTLSKKRKTLQTGLNIYTAGVALQQFFILCFVFLVFTFWKRVSKEEFDPLRVKKANKLVAVVLMSLLLISIRVIFRLIEFTAGAGTPMTEEINQHEWYQYVFDATPMFLALILMNVFHPGTVLAGEDSKFAKLSKTEKKEAKALKKQARADKKAEKRLAAESPA